jgi:Dioxygenase
LTASRFGDESSCTLTPQMTEGPFYFDADKVRRDIRNGREGATLELALRVRDASCEPIADAVVDIWHCDADGTYSEERDPFLRGVQVTNRDGIAEFTTYDSRGERHQRNDSDGIFDPALVLGLSQEGDRYVGTISFDVAAT